MRLIADDLTTEELVRMAAAGDVAARERLVERYEGVVWATVRQFRLGEADAQDAVQSTWLRMIEHLGSLREGARLPGWLAVTARHECVKILRRARRESVGIAPEVADTTPDPALNPERTTINRAMRDLLWQHVDELPGRGRDLLTTLMAADAPRYAELSRSTGMPIGSIGPMRMRYLRALRRRLELAGLGAQDWF